MIMASIHHNGDGLLFNDDQIQNEQCQSYESVMLTLSVPLWTILIFYLLIFLIYYLRRIQYFQLYDKCLPRNAHFRYDFHIITGKYSLNYNKLDSLIILDLLDREMVSTMTIQIPGTTIFNDNQVFVYKHSQPNLRCVKFSIYRRQPIKDVKTIRIAHNCSQADSRIYIYAVNLYDSANGENRFFPITSVVRYRGTQWALQTTFEPKNEMSFKQIGASCYDPFGYSHCPTVLETLTILLYIWCASFCFGHLIGVHEILDSVSLHALTILFLTGTSAAVICFVHLYLIKSHIVDLHYDTIWLEICQWLSLFVVVVISICFWILATNQTNQCWAETRDWIASTLSSASLLSLGIMVAYWIFNQRRYSKDKQALDETDAILTKTNSKTQLEFVTEPTTGISLCCKPRVANNTAAKRPSETASKTNKTTASDSRSAPKNVVGRSGQQASGGKNKSKENIAQRTTDSGGKKEDETLDNAYGRYIKTRNRNSISQYV